MAERRVVVVVVAVVVLSCIDKYWRRGEGFISCQCSTSYCWLTHTHTSGCSRAGHLLEFNHVTGLLFARDHYHRDNIQRAALPLALGQHHRRRCTHTHTHTFNWLCAPPSQQPVCNTQSRRHSLNCFEPNSMQITSCFEKLSPITTTCPTNIAYTWVLQT